MTYIKKWKLNKSTIIWYYFLALEMWSPCFRYNYGIQWLDLSLVHMIIQKKTLFLCWKTLFSQISRRVTYSFKCIL